MLRPAVPCTRSAFSEPDSVTTSVEGGGGGAGVDRFTDFSLAEGVRVRLDSGTAYTLAQAGADTIISFGGGGQMVLANVQLASLADGWITVG
jgi:hypothetical protein